MQKPSHYWAIHKEVCWKAWNRLTNRETQIIANDVDGKSELAKGFAESVATQAQTVLEDGLHRLNRFPRVRRAAVVTE